MNDLLRWLFTPALTLSPVGVLGFAFIYSGIRGAMLRALRRRSTDIIDLPRGGRIELTGARPEFVAEVLERTGGRLRPKGQRWPA